MMDILAILIVCAAYLTVITFSIIICALGILIVKSIFEDIFNV